MTPSLLSDVTSRKPQVLTFLRNRNLLFSTGRALFLTQQRARLSLLSPSFFSLLPSPSPIPLTLWWSQPIRQAPVLGESEDEDLLPAFVAVGEQVHHVLLAALRHELHLTGTEPHAAYTAEAWGQKARTGG